MSRHPISGTCRDSATGQVRGSSLISVYLAGTSTVASIYTASTGGTPVNSVTSDAVGRFSFYVDESDYPLTQLFKIISSKIGFDSITYDNIPFFSLQCIDTDNTLAGNSDKKIPSQKAVKEYVDSRTPTVVASPTAENDFIVGSAALLWVKKTLSEVKSILGLVSDTAYDSTSWNGVTDIAPSKNAVRDKIETVDGKIVFATAAEIIAGTETDKMIAPDQLVASYKLLPPGVISPYGKSTAPDGWLICNGAAYSRTTYADLFAIIGTTFGSGDGSTTFNVPDLRDKVAVGSGSTYALAATGGEATHTLTVAEMPSHRHSEIGWAMISGYAGSGSGNASSTYTGYEGGGQAHNNMQPYVSLNYIIKY